MRVGTRVCGRSMRRFRAAVCRLRACTLLPTPLSSFPSLASVFSLPLSHLTSASSRAHARARAISKTTGVGKMLVRAATTSGGADLQQQSFFG